jgi:hypothetical protein
MRYGLPFSVLLGQSAMVIAQGLMPVPDISNANISAAVEIVSGTPDSATYAYQYTIDNPIESTGSLWMLLVDVSAEFGAVGYSNPVFPVQGGAQTASMLDRVERLAPFVGVRGPHAIAVEQRAPLGWNGGLNREAFVQFAVSDQAYFVPPGASRPGLEIRVNRPPAIRQAIILPWWVPLFENHNDVTQEELADVLETERALPLVRHTLGPTDAPIPSRIRADLVQSGAIGWLTDGALLSTVLSTFDAAMSARESGDGAASQALLQDLIDTVNSAPPNVATPEFRNLAVLNAEFLSATTSVFITRPTLHVDPLRGSLRAGSVFELHLEFVDAANDDEPITGQHFVVRCAQDFDCANVGPDLPLPGLITDVDGRAQLSFVGEAAGIDRVDIGEEEGPVFLRWATVEVQWTADSDLVVSAFAPPMIVASTGDTIYLTDRTENVGSKDVPNNTITRYYISATAPVDPSTATALGQRVVPPLALSESADSIEVAYVIPPGFYGDVNYLAACADDDFGEIEANETNNCSFSELGSAAQAALVVSHSTGNPPVADAGGPYLVCSTESLSLDGGQSFDPDEGMSLSGSPPFDQITAYEWDLEIASGDPFDVIAATSATPLIGAGLPIGQRQIALRVVDNAAAAFGLLGNIEDTNEAALTVGDCGCTGPLDARAKPTKVQLTWSPVTGAATYDIHRSVLGLNRGFAVVATGHVTDFATYLDPNLTNDVTYWYRITPRDAQGAAICDFSVSAFATPRQR